MSKPRQKKIPKLQSLIEFLDVQCPPFVAAVVARVERPGTYARRLRICDIAKDSGISERTCYRIAHNSTWANYLQHASSFLRACNVDVTQMNRHRKFFKRKHFDGSLFEHVPGQHRNTFIKRFAQLCGEWMNKKRGKPKPAALK